MQRQIRSNGGVLLIYIKHATIAITITITIKSLCKYVHTIH